jgi:HEAT repeat protein
MLGAADPSVRWAAAMASGRLGKAALLRISTTLGRLCDGDNEQEVRLAAILASIGLIADVDAPETLATLAKWIVIPNMHVRVAALQAVARLRTAPSAELVAALVQAIRDCDENLQCLAAEVAGILGVAATPNILAALGPMIRHRSELVQAAALSAVSSIGAAAPPDILVALVKLFVHPRTTGSMRLGIADALCVLGREGVRLFIRHRWFRHPKVVLRTTKELAGEEILAPSPGFSQPPS